MAGLVNVPSTFDVNTKLRLDNITLIGMGTIIFSAIILWRLSK